MQEIAKSTITEQYGVDNVFKLPEFYTNAKSISRIESVKLWKERRLDIEYIDDNIVKIKNACPIHGDIELPFVAFRYRTRGINPDPHHYCLKCFPPNLTSFTELKIKDFLESSNIKFLLNNRKIIAPLELDFYLKDYNIAIEVNGIYYHSINGGTDKNYHKIKSDICDKNNIHLLHVWENSLKNKLDIIKDEILRLCNKLDTINKNFDIQIVDKNTAIQFYQNNSIYDYDIQSVLSIGLLDKTEIIKIIIFDIDIENIPYISSICTKNGISISNNKIWNKKLLAFGKSYFKNLNYISDKIYAISDRDFCNFNDCQDFGFNNTEILDPEPFYIDHDFRCTNYISEVSDNFICFDSGKIKWSF